MLSIRRLARAVSSSGRRHFCISNWETKKLSPHFGVRITNFDFKRADAIVTSRELVRDHGFVVFRGLDMTQEEFKMFSGAFATLYSQHGTDPHYLRNTDTDSRITPTVKQLYAVDAPLDMKNFPVTANGPTQVTMLHPVSWAPHQGKTLFSHGISAFAGLSQPMQDMLSKLTCVHGHNRKTPCVINHPDSKEPVLSQASIEQSLQRITSEADAVRIAELHHRESAVIMGFLRQHVNRAEFLVEHDWKNGDLIVYDNLAVHKFAFNKLTCHHVCMAVYDHSPASVMSGMQEAHSQLDQSEL